MPWLCNTCSDCPKGKYTNQEGNGFTTSCKNCNYGDYSDQTGQTSCKECSAGKYTGSTTFSNWHTACKNCDVGYYSDENGENWCTLDNKCSSGKYYQQSTPRTAAGECKTCAAGKWKEVMGQFYGSTIVIQHHHTSCDDQGSCGTGKGNAAYNTPNSDKVCENCVGAQYSDVDDIYPCKTGTPCGVNQHIVACNSGCTSDPGCTACPTGKHIPFSSQRTSCFDKCGTGKYALGGTTPQCSNCPVGTYQDETSHDHASCKSCYGYIWGDYMDSTIGEYECYLAAKALGSPPRYYDDPSDARMYIVTESTTSTPPGCYKIKSDGADAIVRYNANNDNNPYTCTNTIDCLKKQVNTQTQTSATVGGTYVSSGATKCIACGDGYDNVYGNGGTCDACTTGKYAMSGDTCTNCDELHKQTQTTSTVGGTYVSSSATKCVACADGYDNTNGGACDACAAGKFATSGNVCGNCGGGYVASSTYDGSITSKAACKTAAIAMGYGAFHANNYVYPRYGANSGYPRGCYKENSNDNYLHWNPNLSNSQTSVSDSLFISLSSNKQAQLLNTGNVFASSGGAPYCVACADGYFNDDGGACDPCGTGKYDDGGTTCQSCGANKQTQSTTTVGGTYISSGATQCVNCPVGKGSTAGGQCVNCASGSDYGTAAGEGCKTYTQKYLTGSKPLAANMKSNSAVTNAQWKTLSSTKRKRSGFRAMISWLRGNFVNRKAKMRKDDLVLSTTFKTRMGTRADVEVFHPKDGDTECDVDVNQQTDSFDITLTEINEIGVVCKGTIKISKLKLTAINDDSNTYTYYCHDGSGWATGVSISSGGAYSCDGRKFHVN